MEERGGERAEKPSAVEVRVEINSLDQNLLDILEPMSTVDRERIPAMAVRFYDYMRTKMDSNQNTSLGFKPLQIALEENRFRYTTPNMPMQPRPEIAQAEVDQIENRNYRGNKEPMVFEDEEMALVKKYVDGKYYKRDEYIRDALNTYFQFMTILREGGTIKIGNLVTSLGVPRPKYTLVHWIDGLKKL